MLDTPYTRLLGSIMHKVRDQLSNRTKELEVNPQQGRMISYIAEHQDQGLIQKDLADAFKRRGASITSMLQGLEKNGYIGRKVQADNERQKQIFVLQKGKEIVNQIDEMFLAMESHLTESLTEDEKTEFLRLLKKIDSNL
ncbi:MarR family winged helix-turn-helix transcriptional regulator [Gottfriedia acidiceleris]|uniref:MarR family winged helix-turn-helix transcriptional regulator n=1 Tax=Gottfriedia acidiceleris TaxID=371036 RepID=UPI001F1E3234|nr:MarR family transcriptional regulator [Gottfriedia acidiceleris]